MDDQEFFASDVGMNDSIQQGVGVASALKDGPWRPIGTLALDGLVLETTELAEAARRVMAAFAAIERTLVRSFKAIIDGLKANHVVMMTVVYGDLYPTHRRRCALCNPAGFPRPLRVDGNEYRRRTKRRNRR